MKGIEQCSLLVVELWMTSQASVALKAYIQTCLHTYIHTYMQEIDRVYEVLVPLLGIAEQFSSLYNDEENTVKYKDFRIHQTFSHLSSEKEALVSLQMSKNDHGGW